ncbi:MAG TPA: HAMP domain-containing sensor histidine kinase [Vicinamibacterales bacterium]|jgi:two-component system C4-dicarboxylate transport sensor histidine kinase DctB
MAKDGGDGVRIDDLITLNRSATVARLMFGAVHEVNNALQVIGGTTELLQLLPDLAAPVADGLRRIHAQNVRAAAALAQVMVFARQKSDAHGFVNLRDVVARSVALRTYAVGRSRLAIAQRVPAEGHLTVVGSAVLLQQALLNLVVNAEQALTGRPGGAIAIGVERQGAWLRVTVSDDGPGVDPDFVITMFEPFVTTRPREEAAGLGLTVARAIAESHGGTLTYEARSPGAAFILRLPSAR